MSDAPAPKPLTLVQINGRIDELEAQRNNALARCAQIAGERAELIDLVKILKAENDRLTALLNGRDGSEPAAAPNDPETPLAPSGAAEAVH
ncbi:UNVERIFIED_CONTAM: hypothetical protein Q9R58_28815 [Methylobacteriaceae bacterium AG10]|nr:hypothetical protein [Methylobacteriaceae bacterium AG10]